VPLAGGGLQQPAIGKRPAAIDNANVAPGGASRSYPRDRMDRRGDLRRDPNTNPYDVMTVGNLVETLA
jgi:hypothetical protein